MSIAIFADRDLVVHGVGGERLVLSRNVYIECQDSCYVQLVAVTDEHSEGNNHQLTSYYYDRGLPFY